VHQNASLAHEKALSLHHLEVEDRLDLTASDSFDCGDSAYNAEAVARLEVARRYPTLSGFPKPMDARGSDYFPTEINVHESIRFVLHCGDNRLIGKFRRTGILGQDLVTDLD
jgi:hypothetical protein